ncbi:hypothetical protein PSU4_56860 [Pseudonocardia sulfidoxydans NBRC 16205]|uniref:Uncharacterized protein n=1 Tax=Pseudonocardia sulfidoxydans NBRC 16205 TaxID=1223511 RepID=A0A511DPJ2_9PSEU|nr:hypothetical protein [Pseudonocardia sulfidoxydans]GEL26732.1 hypothetical protein PSU4_56860 [Pseudonocardia sulfidoxydans NBRC 16205]
MSAAPLARPGSVTVVVVLVWISAILQIIVGVLLLIVAATVGTAQVDVSSGVIVAVGIFTLVIGLLTAAVASRLGKGGNGARIIVTVLEVLQIVGAITTLSVYGSTGAGSGSIGNIAIAVIILALLWNNRANEFFARR